MATFESGMSCTVTLLQRGGTFVEDIKATIEEDQIVIIRSDLKIKVGDLIRRGTTRGEGEVYKVLDPVFYEQFSTVEAHYQLEVAKLAPSEALCETVKISGSAQWPQQKSKTPPSPKPARKPPAKPTKRNLKKEPTKPVEEVDVPLPGEVSLDPLPEPAKKVAKAKKPTKEVTKAPAAKPHDPKDADVLSFPADIAKELLEDLEEEDVQAPAKRQAAKTPTAAKKAPSAAPTKVNAKESLSIEALDKELEEEQQAAKEATKKATPPKLTAVKPQKVTASKADTKESLSIEALDKELEEEQQAAKEATKKTAPPKSTPTKLQKVTASKEEPKESLSIEMLDRELEAEQQEKESKKAAASAKPSQAVAKKTVPSPKKAPKPTPVATKKEEPQEEINIELLDQELEEAALKAIEANQKASEPAKPKPAPKKEVKAKAKPPEKKAAPPKKVAETKKKPVATKKVEAVKPAPASKPTAAPLQQQVAEHLEAIRAEIQRVVKDPGQKEEALELVSAIAAQCEAGKPSKAVVATLIKGLPQHVTITTLGTFVLECLS